MTGGKELGWMAIPEKEQKSRCDFARQSESNVPDNSPVPTHKLNREFLFNSLSYVQPHPFLTLSLEQENFNKDQATATTSLLNDKGLNKSRYLTKELSKIGYGRLSHLEVYLPRKFCPLAPIFPYQHSYILSRHSVSK